jgi:hypothetical protein
MLIEQDWVTVRVEQKKTGWPLSAFLSFLNEDYSAVL